MNYLSQYFPEATHKRRPSLKTLQQVLPLTNSCRAIYDFSYLLCACAGFAVTSLLVYDPDDGSYAGPGDGDVTITSGTVPFSVEIAGYTVSLVVSGALDREVS